MTRRLVLYHGNCIDGFTAAWAAWHKFGDAMTEYRPTIHADQPDVGGADVYMLDICYPRETMERIAREAHSLWVIDHHKTARDAMVGFQTSARVQVDFDMDRSGAGMAWDLLMAGNERPWLVDFVEDRDLWRFDLRGSKEVNAWIGAHKRETFADWDRLNEAPGGPAAALEKGHAVLQFVDRYVSEMAAQARLVDFEGYRVPVVNAPYINISELVGKLAESAPFAVGWMQRGDGMFTYSLRSRGDGGIDVSEIAKRYGGGGHRNSAGFSVDKPPMELR